ncbi:MAG: diguanylate cyclase [Desulfobacteraceae bacterium]|nr:diguanylate cyclase [Desulfobacteraceae bacterium]
MRESEERYRDLFENTADLIQNAGPDGRLLYVNPAWRKTLGYGTDEIFRLNVIDIIHPEQRPRCREMFRRIIAGEKVEKIETAFLAKDGRKVLVAGNASCKYAEGKPLYTRGIFHDITERKELELRLRSMATTDELTGAYNRRMFDEILCKQMSRAERQGEPLSMVMLDIDHFKKINDNFGHVAGDEVLRSLAALLRENIRDMDFFARWGGEEFIILLPATPPEAARHLAERLRHIVAGHGFGQVGPVTISLGVARYRQGEPREALLRRADESLYDAKRTGRNKVVMAGGERAFFCMFPAKQGDQQGSKCETVPAHPDS